MGPNGWTPNRTEGIKRLCFTHTFSFAVRQDMLLSSGAETPDDNAVLRVTTGKDH